MQGAGNYEHSSSYELPRRGDAVPILPGTLVIPNFCMEAPPGRIEITRGAVDGEYWIDVPGIIRAHVRGVRTFLIGGRQGG